jgi:hypothetical protein
VQLLETVVGLSEPRAKSRALVYYVSLAGCYQQLGEFAGE